jgi:hypothetical protein
MSSYFANYVARKMGTVDVGKVICSLDQVAISASLTVLFKKGNPLLDRFNILMRRYLEAGFQENLWTKLQHRVSLRGGERFTEAAGDRYFEFSFSHLMPLFVVLLVRTLFSTEIQCNIQFKLKFSISYTTYRHSVYHTLHTEFSILITSY